MKGNRLRVLPLLHTLVEEGRGEEVSHPLNRTFMIQPWCIAVNNRVGDGADCRLGWHAQCRPDLDRRSWTSSADAGEWIGGVMGRRKCRMCNPESIRGKNAEFRIREIREIRGKNPRGSE